MNLFTDHNFGAWADDGYGNLRPLTYGQVSTGLYCLLSDTEEVLTEAP